MRLPMIAASIAALLAADAAGAQRMMVPGPGTQPGPNAPGSRWGSHVGGRWWAGANAPGGWGAYRRPVRGWTLPAYWISPGFAIGDWGAYGLGAPPAGYGWSRYYDDAVLTDGNGRVYDCVSGIDWDRGGYAAGYDQGYTGGYAPQAPAYPQPSPYAGTAGYAPGAGYPPPPAYVEQRNSGVGGAVAGAVVGGVAGNLIAGRGNRVAGTLIGAGVGGAAGYAIDRNSYHRVPVAPRYPAPGYGGPGPGAGYPPPPPAYPVAPGYVPPAVGPAGTWQSPDGGTTVTTTSAGGYGGGSTTVVTIQTAPVVTTTTTEIVDSGVTYTRHYHHPVRHKWVRRAECNCY